MPPKAKGKAKAKGKPGKGGDADEEKVQLPPPPVPSLVRFPEFLTGPPAAAAGTSRGAPEAPPATTASENEAAPAPPQTERPPPSKRQVTTAIELKTEADAAASRCVLMAWRDSKSEFKLQTRAYTGEERDAADGWEDHKQVKAKSMPGRKNGIYMVSELQNVRAQFRLVLKDPEAEAGADNQYASWYSAPSDPVITAVDPPTQPACNAEPRSDHENVGVVLQFGSTDPSFARAAEVDPSIAEDGPWAAWPGLAVCRVVTRWRFVRYAVIDGIADAENEDTDDRRVPTSVLAGDWQMGPLAEVGRGTCPFDKELGTWSSLICDVPHGLVCKFEVRAGTAYRWSAWSEESEEVQVVIAAPKPQGFIEVVSASDCSASLRWMPFELASPTLELCEYRVRLCQLDTLDSDSSAPHLEDGDEATQTPPPVPVPWSEENAYIAGIFTAANIAGRPVEFEVKALTAEMCYSIRVDARYPFTGDRRWSLPCVAEGPVYTSTTLRPSPAAPVAIPSDEVENLLSTSGDEDDVFPDGCPWLALLIESSASEDYRIEYKASLPSQGLPAQAEAVHFNLDIEGEGEESGMPDAEAPQGLAKPDWQAAAEVRTIGMPSIGDGGKAWTAVAVRLSEDCSGGPLETVLCRLRHRRPWTVPRHLGLGSFSQPLVPLVAPPRYCTAEVRFASDGAPGAGHGCFCLMARFFLGTAPRPDATHGYDSLAVAAAMARMAASHREQLQQQTVENALTRSRSGSPLALRRTTRCHQTGHRFVSQVQMRVRICKSEAQAEAEAAAAAAEEDGSATTRRGGEWMTMASRPLPGPVPCICHNSDIALDLPESPAEAETLPPELTLFWDVGERHEVLLSEKDGLSYGQDYEVEIRVGTSTRWSPWTAVPGTVSFTVTAPYPLPGIPKRVPPAMLDSRITSPTTASLRFQPFQLEQEVTSAEYIITATPQFSTKTQEEAEAEEEDNEGVRAPQAENNVEAGEGPCVVQKTFTAFQEPFPTRDHTAQSFWKAERRALQDVSDKPFERAIQRIEVLWAMAQQSELDAYYKQADHGMIEVELTGLLPAMGYKVTVEARYAALLTPEAAKPGPPLTDALTMPCGAAPPEAPLPVKPPASLSLTGREVCLQIADRPDYVLQSLGVGAKAGGGWYPVDKMQFEEDGKWWATGPAEAALASLGEWGTVPTRKVDGATTKPGCVMVVAELPAFGEGTANASLNQNLPDIVRFRLCVATRHASHPCRWVGNASELTATCIAPTVAAPMLKRIITDKKWHVSISFFAHTDSRPERPATIAEARAETTPPEPEILAQLMDPAGPADGDGAASCGGKGGNPPDADEDAVEAASDAPSGFGHRSVRWAQARVRHVGEDGKWIVFPEVPIGQCKVRDAQPIKSNSSKLSGELHALTLEGVDNRLALYSIYQVQVRLGDGRTWSAWSLSSQAFEHSIPSPKPHASQSETGAEEEAGAGLEVTTLSASAVRFRWGAFLVPPGVSEVSYLLRADPVCEAEDGLQGSHPVEQIHVLPAEPAGTKLEALLRNLLPNTEYLFSVAARYPYIGPHTWGEALKANNTSTLDDSIADWPAPPAPVVFPRDGPRPFALAEEALPFFHPNERAVLLAFTDVITPPDGISYHLEYANVGMAESTPAGESEASGWMKPLEVLPVDVPDQRAAAIEAAVAPWKLPPRLWRVRLPSVTSRAPQGSGAAPQFWEAHSQRVQFRLAADTQHNCPVTRWFSASSAPLCVAMAAPLETKTALMVSDSSLDIRVAFRLDLAWTPSALRSEIGAAGAIGPTKVLTSTTAVDGTPQLPPGYGHSWAARFQVRSRHSPRPPGPPSGEGKKPTGVPWSSWVESAETDLKPPLPGAEEGEEVPGNDGRRKMVTHEALLALPGNLPLAHGSWYQVSVRIGDADGTCWSDWSEPSTPLKVYVAPAKAERTTDVLTVDKFLGNNVRLRWNFLRAHCDLEVVEYAVYIREVLRDGSDICQRQLGAQFIGRAATVREPGPDVPETTHTVELRDLRRDVMYIFTLAARYPHIGSREFEDALHSAQTSLKPLCAPLPMPVQLPVPEDRMRKLQGARFVFMKWSLEGILPLAGSNEEDFEVDTAESLYDLQTLPEGAGENEWMRCHDVNRLRIDGTLAWVVKDIPGHALRNRFRLWEKHSGRFGRSSALMLSHIEPVTKLSATQVVSESSAQIILRAPLNGPKGTPDFVCRYQVRYREEAIESEWRELPMQMLWHRQNDHLQTADPVADATGSIPSGITTAPDGAVSQSSAPAPPFLPTLPLASVGPTGKVTRQRCIIAALREEDGLQQNTAYIFAIRAGDLYRLSDWTEAPAPGAMLGFPAPRMSPLLDPQEKQLRLSAFTATGFAIEWPQFMPATDAGVPIHAEVEYLLELAPAAPVNRLAGRTARKAEHEVLPPVRQWFMTSTLAKGASPEKMGQGTPLSATATALQPSTAYELRLHVRYARLGSRSWKKVLVRDAATSKSEADVVSMDGSRVGTRVSTSDSRMPNQAQGGSAAAQVVPKESPCSLPFLESPLSRRPREDSGEAGEKSSRGTLPAQALERLDAAQEDVERLIQGGGHLGRSALTEALPAPLLRPPGFEPFWRRDPASNFPRALGRDRPAAPEMPAAGHSAMQLDLCGRKEPWAPLTATTSAEAMLKTGSGLVEGPGDSMSRTALIPRPPVATRNSTSTTGRTDYPRRRFVKTDS